VNTEKRLLIVDDDEDILLAAKLLLKRHFDIIKTCHRPEFIPQVMSENNFDAILLDMNFSPGESSGQQGFFWLNKILEIDPDAVVVMITAHGDMNIAVEAMKHGATDFIGKPWQNEKVIATLSSATQLHQSRFETKKLKQSNQALVETLQGSHQSLLGSSQTMLQVQSLINKSAPTDANVLILGENGTGKELVARELHQQSLRNEQVFMSIDLGAVSESLFESELFGHKKGAFTGATKDRVGRLVTAHGGTLFLDEISNIPLHLQAKLLTVLEQRKVTPLGENNAIDIDVRVISATNINRTQLQNEKLFRQDLLFRLNTVEIELPPLRKRVDDIAEIAEYYAVMYAKKYRKSMKKLSTSALHAAKENSWLGNVRALRHAVERAVILSEGEMLEAGDLQISQVVKSEANFERNIEGNTEGNNEERPFSSSTERALLSISTESPDEELHLETIEKQLVETALKKHRYNVSKAAKALGLTRASLYRRMEKYDF
jgi:DNA-binding NtrC family response regulator